MQFVDFLNTYGEAAKTSAGFFWKSGWAFVLGYFVSAMIQAFVPKGRLTPYLGSADTKSVGLATLFGTISSSCSFAALATARALVMKGAHFVAAVAFMFASTNLVIELGILIFIFLGWQFLAAEIVGGLLLILISRSLMLWTHPKSWLQQARDKVNEEADDEEQDFDWRERMFSADGWRLVGKKFVSEWAMVWHEIAIGFTVAGFVAVFVPASFWKAIFFADQAAQSPLYFPMVLENALLAPFVAAATFIGSMGNIPLATVLNSSGVLFAGIMGFIYSDLMVPPLVEINARYYGAKTALYIAGIMYVSIVCTAIVLHYAFALLGMTPESSHAVKEVTQFKIDYTFWMNIAAVLLVGWLSWLNHAWHTRNEEMAMDMGGSGKIKRTIAWTALAIIAIGIIVHLVLAL
ncbi:permease [Oceanidesulfovibrio marinus]|uniref:Permease n=1 Tax=Oceanidesulfovibrio marinus TaxID=370038 RepID=A0A6P1ZIT1_9BACT|nr:permease [Oceanidesulfovibrio marinus]TVM33040.1 permease [Oceanidesulfovibrio marinus]